MITVEIDNNQIELICEAVSRFIRDLKLDIITCAEGRNADELDINEITRLTTNVNDLTELINQIDVKKGFAQNTL